MATVGVKHSKVVTIPDDPNYPVGSDEWNDFHVVTGLENVDNTSDANKPVSTAQAAADAAVASTAAAATALKANIASPTFTGTPAAPTASANNNSTQLATTAYVDGGLATRDTAIALKATTTYVDSADALKAPLASPGLTGTPTAPTAAPGTNTTQLATTAFVAAATAGAGVSSLNGQTGAVVAYFPPQGRLTLTSGTPVMASSVAASTTVYYTPYAGNMVPLYDGTNMVPTAFAEVSQATTDATKSPAAVAANKVYDLFAWNDAGTKRVTRGPAWTNDTTRGYTLTYTNGIALNTSSITNGPAALRGTWVGTIRSNGSSSIDYIFGAVGAGGVAGNFCVWNAYNRVDVASFVSDSASSWTYAVANTWRAANGSSTARTSFILGSSEDAVSAIYVVIGVAGASTSQYSGIGVNSTTAFSGTTCFYGGTSNAPSQSAHYAGLPGIGYNFISAIEATSTTTASTWFSAATFQQTGLIVRLKM